MNTRNDITLREGDGPNPPDLLEQLKTELESLLFTGTKSGRRWLFGKSEQEVAKAVEIKTRVIAEIAKIQNDCQRLRDERDAAAAGTKNEQHKNDQHHKARMYELETERFKAKADALLKAVEALKQMRDMGIEVDFQIVSNLLLPRSDQPGR